MIDRRGKIVAIAKRRAWLRRTYPFSISLMVNDIIFNVYAQQLENHPTNISQAVDRCRGSDRAIRKHIKSLIDENWLELTDHENDRRQALLTLSRKTIILMDEYLEFD